MRPSSSNTMWSTIGESSSRSAPWPDVHLEERERLVADDDRRRGGVQVEVHLAGARIEERADRLDAAVHRRADRILVGRVGREQRQPRLAVLRRLGACSTSRPPARRVRASPWPAGYGRAPALQRVERGTELADLRAAEVGDEVAPHPVDVDRRRRLERRPPGVGEHRQRDPSVGGARLRGPRDPARTRPSRRRVSPLGDRCSRVGEIAHAQAPLGRLGEVHEHRVVALVEPEALDAAPPPAPRGRRRRPPPGPARPASRRRRATRPPVRSRPPGYRRPVREQ